MRYTDEQRTAVLKRIGSGESLHAVSKDSGIPKASLSRWAQAVGLDGTSRTQTTRAGTEANRANAQARRTANLETMIAKIGDLLDRMDAPHKVFMALGGKDGGVESFTYDRATSGDVRNYAVSVGVLVDKMRLEMGEPTEHHQISGVDPAKVRAMRDELAERRATRAS
jgi:hypothetical protein